MPVAMIRKIRGGAPRKESRVRHFLSLAEIGPDNLAGLVRHSLEIAAVGGARADLLAGKAVGIYFRGTSTRTRTAFTVGALRSGASIISYGPNDLQVATGETLQDTGRVLGGYLDALVIRTNSPDEEMRALAEQDEMAIINARPRHHPRVAGALARRARPLRGRGEQLGRRAGAGRCDDAGDAPDFGHARRVRAAERGA